MGWRMRRPRSRLLVGHDGQDVRNVGNVYYAVTVDVGSCIEGVVCHEG